MAFGGLADQLGLPATFLVGAVIALLALPLAAPAEVRS